jgi:hypothetical protein
MGGVILSNCVPPILPYLGNLLIPKSPYQDDLGPFDVLGAIACTTSIDGATEVQIVIDDKAPRGAATDAFRKTSTYV